jgi:hypothetical protein
MEKPRKVFRIDDDERSYTPRRELSGRDAAAQCSD